MNFTREPIIETVITPKEGYKLIVRSTKVTGGEDYTVEAVEVVSFGNALFFRSQERPKPFLVPVTDFEIVEAKETRVVLKNATFERSIKIGGGKEAGLKAQKTEEEPAEVEERLEKKRERRRHRRRRTSTQQTPAEGETPQPAEEKKAPEGGGADDETAVSSSIVRRLIPPPPSLISEKYPKEKPPKTAQGDVLPESVDEEKPKKKEKPPEEKPEVEGGDVQRVALHEQESLTSTSFSTLDPSPKPFGKFW